MNYFEQIEAMHQAVREYVEAQEPDYKVAEIEADFTTSYKPTLASKGEFLPRQDFVLTEIKAQFRVNAYYINKVLEYKLYVMPDGKLYLANQEIYIAI